MRKPVVFFLISAFVLLAGYALSAGRTVQINMAFSIGSKDDNITAGGNFVSSQDGDLAVSMVSSGTTRSATNVTAYSSTEYMLQLAEGVEDNRFLIVFANASNLSLQAKAAALSGRRIPAKTFGSYTTAIPDSVFLFLRLVYEDADITTRTRWGRAPVQLIIKNNGGTPPQISIELVK